MKTYLLCSKTLKFQVKSSKDMTKVYGRISSGPDSRIAHRSLQCSAPSGPASEFGMREERDLLGLCRTDFTARNVFVDIAKHGPFKVTPLQRSLSLRCANVRVHRLSTRFPCVYQKCREGTMSPLGWFQAWNESYWSNSECTFRITSPNQFHNVLSKM